MTLFLIVFNIVRKKKNPIDPDLNHRSGISTIFRLQNTKPLKLKTNADIQVRHAIAEFQHACNVVVKEITASKKPGGSQSS